MDFQQCPLVAMISPDDVNVMISHSKIQMEKIALLNNKGVECCLSAHNSEQEATEAALYFRRALDCATANGFAVPKTSVFATTHRTNFVKTNGLPAIRQRGEYDEGMNIFVEPINIKPELSSITNFVATIQYNLGILCARLDENDMASNLFSEAMQSAQKMGGLLPYDKNDGGGGVSMNAILHNIGRIQYKMGNYEDALMAYRSALQIGRNLCTSDSLRNRLEIAATLNCLGVLHFHLMEADTNKAMGLFVESLSIRCEIFGTDRDDVDVATTLNNIGRVHFKMGEHENAIKVYYEALSMRRRLFGDDHPDVAATIYNIGQACYQSDKLTEAMTHYEEFLATTKKLVGVKSPDVATALRGMAQIHQKWKNYDKAILLYEEALCVGKAALGPTNEDVAITLNKLGNILFQIGDLDRAIFVYKEGLAIERVALDLLDNRIAVTLTNIAQVYNVSGKYEAALKLHKEAVVIQRHHFGKYHPSVCVSLSSIASIYYHTRSYTKALNTYQQVLAIQRESCGGDDHLDIASTLNSIGLVLSELKFQDMALQALNESLRIRRNIFGLHHREIAILLYNIATVYLELGDDDEALRYYKDTLKVERVAIDCENDDMIVTIQQIGLVYQQRGELEEAIKYFSEAFDIQRKKMGEEGEEIEEEEEELDKIAAIARTLNNIGNVYLQRGQTRQMVDTLSESLRHFLKGGESHDSLVLSGFKLYSMSKMHPECAAVA